MLEAGSGTKFQLLPFFNIVGPFLGLTRNLGARHNVIIETFPRCSCVYFLTMLTSFLADVGCMCNVNMCIMFYKQLCHVGSLKSSFINAHGVGMKFNVC